LENFVSILLAWWVVPFTLLFFWLRFLPRHDWLGTSLHVVLIAGAAWFGVYSYRLAVRTLSGGARATEKHGDARKYYRFLRGKGKEEGNQPLRVRMWHTVRRYLPSGMEAACAGVAIVLVLSAGAAISPGDDLLSTIGYQTYADLTDDDVSTKPSGWTGREETAEVEIAQVKGADLEDRDFRHADARGAFLVKAKLAGAKLAGVKLAGANLSGANLTDADLHRVNLSSANLTHANLLRANLSSANLVHANLSGADLHRANLSSANLTHANLSGADLSSANLSDASLRVMVDHRRGMVRRLVANLSGANLSGVDQLTQGQLGGACGDEDTQLPQGLTIRTCPVTAPEHSPADLVR
jgi:uncharacterized protein YjbI with pentapeptide repeats